MRFASTLDPGETGHASAPELKRTDHARHRLHRNRARLLWPGRRLRRPLRTPLRPAMTLDLTLGALVTLGLLGYLTYALVRPERF